MKWPAALAVLLVWAAGAAAWGDPLSGAALPADTRWVIHVDVDAARLATPLWDLTRTRIIEPREALLSAPLRTVETVTGMKLPQDLHDVTLYGTAYDEAAVCLVIHGKMDQTSVLAYVRKDPEFRQQDRNGHTILTWRDKARDRLTYAAFAKDDIAVISPSTKVLEDALDARDGRLPGLKPDSPLAPAASRQFILWLAGRDLSDLPRAQKVETPLMSALESASLSIRWANDRVITESVAQAKTDQAARQLQAVAEGIKALVALSASDEHAPPRVRLLSDALQNLTVQAQGQSVRSEWPLDITKIESVMNMAAPPAATAPTTAPAPKRPAPPLP
jgi:hypothetical protein